MKKWLARLCRNMFAALPERSKMWLRKRVLDDFDLSSISLIDSEKTLEKVRSLIEEKTAGGCLRFGDGDILLLDGKNDIFQAGSKELSSEMREAFSLNGKGIMKSLPINSTIFGFEKGMTEGKHKRPDDDCLGFLHRVYPYFIGCPIYSAVALHYCAEFSPDRCIDFLQFLKKHSPIIIGNRNIPEKVISTYLGGCLHIKTPERDAYLDIDRVEREFLTACPPDGYHVVIISMGCAGRVLTKRLLKRGINAFIFDFGSLMDALSGDMTRDWLEMMDPNSLNRIIASLEAG